jgi:hypothetical protein
VPFCPGSGLRLRQQSFRLPHVVELSQNVLKEARCVAVAYKDKTAIVAYDGKTDAKSLTDATIGAGYPSAPKG